MKKIMKKALSLMLALVMVFTLAPMTAQAAAGDAIENSSVNSYYDGITAAAGETIYVEIYGGTDGDYDLTVTSTGAFSVTPCAEGSSTWYNEGSNTVASTDNKVETKISFYYGYGAIAITNTSSQECAYTCTVNFPEGTQSNPKAITLGLDDTANVTVAAGGQYFVSLKLPEIGVQYNLKLTGNTGFGYSVNPYAQPAWDTNGVYTVAVKATDMSGAVTFILSNKTQSDITITLDVNEQAIGEEGNPDLLTVGTKTTKAVDGAAYWYKWTPAVDGKLTITVDETASASDGWYVNVSSHSIQKSNCWDDAAVFTFDVTAEETVLVGVSVPGLDQWGELSPYGYGTGNVVFTATFEESSEDDNSGEGTGTGTGEGTVDTTGREINANYYYKNQELTTGTTSIMPQYGYPTTLYTFSATQAGTYTITLSDTEGKVAFYGSNPDYPYDYAAEDEVEKTYTYTLNYKEANAPAIIGVSDTMMCDITITRTGDVQEEETLEKETWTLAVSPEAYVFDGEEKDLEQLIYGMADGEVFYVMDDNGYFHVAPVEDLEDDEEAIFGYSYVGDKKIEELPLVLVDLSDKVVSLEAALAERDFLVAVYDEETGKPTGIVDFTAALKELLACADAETGLYPLTLDLFIVFAEGGEANGWYMNTESTTGVVAAAYPETDGIDPAFLHAFAMYYLDQDITTLDKEEQVIAKDDMTAIIETNKDKETVISTVVTNAAGEEVEVKFTFAAGTMKAVEGKEEYSFKVELVEDYSKATADKAEIEKDEFVIRINFEYEGKLPAEATITIPVGTTYAGKTLYYYQILADGTLKYVCDAPVDANGNAKVVQDHCSDYVLLKEKINDNTPLNPGKTGDATNIALWVAILGLGVVAVAGSVVMKKREF